MALQVTPSGSSTSIFIYPVIHDLLCSTWGNIFNFSIVSNHLFSEFQCVTICFGNITGIKIGKIKIKIFQFCKLIPIFICTKMVGMLTGSVICTISEEYWFEFCSAKFVLVEKKQINFNIGLHEINIFFVYKITSNSIKF